VVIDEMADLMQQEKKLFTEKMAAIAQMARAAGICIIACTQRPSVDVLRGTIKVNFPARGSFRVTTQQDSKTVIGVKGAEQLLGKGDMWLSTPSKPGLQRIHVPLITREDRDKVLAIGLEYGHVMRVPADSMDANGNILPQKEQPKTPAAPTTPAVPVKNGKTTANSGSLKVN
jgi:DNA segregation ATPase FtsK/SpoIIIE-like protein